MSYQANPMQEEYIRNRIRDILHEKIQDRTYNGASMTGGQYVGGRRRKRRKMRGGELDYMNEYMGGRRMKYKKNPVKVAAGRASAKCNPWIVFYREWVNRNASRVRGMSGQEMAATAAKEYRSLRR